MRPATRLVLAAKLLNITLTGSLVLLANNVSPNPGPGPSQPLKVKGLRISHINICCLRNKLTELRLFCDKHRPHVLSLNETWLDDSFLDSELYLPVYQLLRRERGWHCFLYTAENLNPERLDISVDDIEALWFNLSQPNNEDPFWSYLPSAKSRPINRFTESLEEMLNQRTNVVSPNATTKYFQRTMNLLNFRN